MNFTKVKPDKSRASFASREYFKRFLKKKANLHWRTANIFCSTHTKTSSHLHTYKHTLESLYCTTWPSEILPINNAGKCAASHVGVTSNLPISSAESRWRAAEPFPAPSRCVRPSESFWKIELDAFNLHHSTLSPEHVITWAVISLSAHVSECVTGVVSLIFVYLWCGCQPARLCPPIWKHPHPSSPNVIGTFPPTPITSCIYLVGPSRTGSEQTCLSWLAWDRRLCNKTTQVWQKCTLSRSWSLVRQSQVWN